MVAHPLAGCGQPVVHAAPVAMFRGPRQVLPHPSWLAAGGQWRKLAPVPILAQVTEYMERPDEQVVVLFQILAAEINFGYKFQCVRCAAASRPASKLQDCLCSTSGCMLPRGTAVQQRGAAGQLPVCCCSLCGRDACCVSVSLQGQLGAAHVGHEC